MSTPAPAPAIHSTPAALVAALNRKPAAASRAGGAVQVGWGKITAVNSPTCTVQIRGRSTIAGIAHVKAYTPTVGDRVVMLEWPTESGEDRLILGAV